MTNPFETWTWWNWTVAVLTVALCVGAVINIWRGIGDGD